MVTIRQGLQRQKSIVMDGSGLSDVTVSARKVPARSQSESNSRLLSRNSWLDLKTRSPDPQLMDGEEPKKILKL